MIMKIQPINDKQGLVIFYVLNLFQYFFNKSNCDKEHRFKFDFVYNQSVQPQGLARIKSSHLGYQVKTNFIVKKYIEK